MKFFSDFSIFISDNIAQEERHNKICIIRGDLNLPSGVEDLSRIEALKDTILGVLNLGLRVLLISHYKRPKPEDTNDPKYSLQDIANKVAAVLNRPVDFKKQSVFDLDKSDITQDLTLLENLRFYPGETDNSDELARAIANLGDFYINEAFSVSHRAHASVAAITKYLPSYAGLTLQKELQGLQAITEHIKRPYTAIIGGSKISTKIEVLEKLSKTADYLVITGGMANTFLAAKGIDMKNSLLESDYFDKAREIFANTRARIVLPTDFRASNDINVPGQVYKEIPDGFSAFDIGDESIARTKKILSQSKTVLWNGTPGAFEFANFDTSSKAIAAHLAQLRIADHIFAVIGGGETIAALGEYKKRMNVVSTAGGAFLEFIAGYELPGLRALEYARF